MFVLPSCASIPGSSEVTHFSVGKAGLGQVVNGPEPGRWFWGFQPCDKGKGRVLTAGLSEANQGAKE